MTTEASRRIPRPSHNFVPEYQMSGIPHVETRSLVNATLEAGGANGDANARVSNINSFKFTFDSVTRWITINCHGNNANHHTLIYFNETAAKTAYANAENQDKHYYEIDNNQQTQRLEIKCKEVYILPQTFGENFKVSIVAGLTNVAAVDFPVQEYENGFKGIQNNPNP
jgi:hypothetical protein